MKRKCFLLIVSIIYGVSVARASNDTIFLSLDSCLAMATRNSCDIKIAEELQHKAKSEKEAVISMFFPKISLNGSLIYVFKNIEIIKDISKIIPRIDLNAISSELSVPIPDEARIQEIIDNMRGAIINNWKPIELSLKGAYMAGITLQQPIFAGGRIANATKMAALGGKMAKENLILKKQEAIIEAQQSYWLYVSVIKKVQLAKTYKNLLAELEKMVQNVKDVDMASKSDLLKVKVQYNDISLKLLQAEAGLELSRMSLCRIIGSDYTTKIVPTDTIIETEYPNMFDNNTALEDRAEYKLMKLQVEMKRKQITDVMGQYLPVLGVGAMLGYAGGMKIANNTIPSINTSNISLVLSVPISGWWEGSRKINSAKSDKIIAELEMKKNSQLLQLQIEQATLNYKNAYIALGNAVLAIEEAKENLRVSTDRYSVNMETLTDLMISQAVWQTAETNLIDAQIDYRIKQMEYLKVIGKL